DPLIDIGGLLSFWPDPRLGKMPKGFLQGDWPDKDYLREQYARYSGLDLRDIYWYEALACAKTAVIAQQLYARYVAGSTKDARMEKFGMAAKGFALLGRSIIDA
ncbi:MAG: phosphotransferase family protein, partial [Bacteroidota bacterium]